MQAIRVSYALAAVVCFISLTGSLLFAQAPAGFRVIKASGVVMSGLTKRQIKSGDQITSTEKITFGSRGSYLHIVSPEGRRTIGNVPDNSPRDLQQLMRDFLSPDKKQKSSRGLVEEGLQRIIQELSYDTILILGAGRVSLDTSVTTLKKPAGVKAIYSTSSEKTEKQISDLTGFNLGKQHIFGKEPMTSFPSVIVSYMEDMADPVFTPSVMLGSFVPRYPDEQTLLSELRLMTETLKTAGRRNEEIMKELNSYLATEYSPAIPENVRDWVSANKLMK